MCVFKKITFTFCVCMYIRRFNAFKDHIKKDILLLCLISYVCVYLLEKIYSMFSQQNTVYVYNKMHVKNIQHLVFNIYYIKRSECSLNIPTYPRLNDVMLLPQLDLP